MLKTKDEDGMSNSLELYARLAVTHSDFFVLALRRMEPEGILWLSCPVTMGESSDCQSGIWPTAD